MFSTILGRKRSEFQSYFKENFSNSGIKCIFLHILIFVSLQPQTFLRVELLLRTVNSLALLRSSTDRMES